MKTLCDCKPVSGRKNGKWIYYSLNNETVRGFRSYWKKSRRQKRIVFAMKPVTARRFAIHE